MDANNCRANMLLLGFPIHSAELRVNEWLMISIKIEKGARERDGTD